MFQTNYFFSCKKSHQIKMASNPAAYMLGKEEVDNIKRADHCGSTILAF